MKGITKLVCSGLNMQCLFA